MNILTVLLLCFSLAVSITMATHNYGQSSYGYGSYGYGNAFPSYGNQGLGGDDDGDDPRSIAYLYVSFFLVFIVLLSRANIG